MKLEYAPRTSETHHLFVVRLAGEIDIANSLATGEWILHELEASACDAALIDCSRLTFVDATAMSMMLRVQHHAQMAHVVLAWSRLRGLPLRAIRTVGLDEQLALIA
jgi:anti-anti-sigma factor